MKRKVALLARSRRRLGEIILLCLPTAIASILVFWNLTALGLSYWDEYNYIVTAKWFLGSSGGVFHTYEPPVFPFFMALFFEAFGVHDYVAIATSGIFAVLTVALLTITGKRMFGFQVGVIAPILLGLSSLFLFFARLAVTDMTLTFFFTVTCVAAYRALKSQRVLDAVLAGVLFVACNGVKYSGVFALIVPILFVPVLLLSARVSQKLKAALRYAKVIFVMSVPSVVSGLLFLALLGIGGSLKGLITRRGLEQLTLELPHTLQKGFEKFQAVGITLHAGQLRVSPLGAGLYYSQVLMTWVSIPILLLAVLGLLSVRPKRGAEVFTAIWAAVVFVVFSSIEPYAREILPLLPPLALLAAIGLTKIPNVLLSFARARHVQSKRILNLNYRAALSIAILGLVLGLSVLPAIQTVSVTHSAYRQAGDILKEIAGKQNVLADTQLVMAYYYPVYFGNLTTQELAKAKYLIVDYEIVPHRNAAYIDSLEKQGRIVLVGIVHNDVYDIIYLDVTNFQQLQTWNYTDIRIYKVVNATSSVP